MNSDPKPVKKKKKERKKGKRKSYMCLFYKAQSDSAHQRRRSSEFKIFISRQPKPLLSLSLSLCK
jgi:hypothetical protein